MYFYILITKKKKNVYITLYNNIIIILTLLCLPCALLLTRERLQQRLIIITCLITYTCISFSPACHYIFNYVNGFFFFIRLIYSSVDSDINTFVYALFRRLTFANIFSCCTVNTNVIL